MKTKKDDFAAFQQRILDQIAEMENIEKQKQAEQLALQLIAEVRRRRMDVNKLANVRTLDELRVALGLPQKGE
jgi:hypothetical protein